MHVRGANEWALVLLPLAAWDLETGGWRPEGPLVQLAARAQA